ncbi:coiled-coil domain-containing protein 134-like isoform X1 [Penaeus chinensis]|uniref:coiled-coil domain-containing protein 134-like isoform X1 n=1 Tax=Penaeus chinensis TaxID=139456 RepID=UPI001FB72762|nr:coiled-coil domain-containing protein 134-like isoform X1 [Penaeus chinensis]
MNFPDPIFLFLLVCLTHLGRLCLSERKGQGSDTTVNQLKLFQSLFQERRNQHKTAIGTITKLDYARQVKMIKIIAENAFQVLEMSQVKLREAGYIPGMDFPEDELLREALSKTLENTVFMGEILLHFPDTTHKILQENKPWELLFTWGVFFASQSKFLDKSTNTLIYLVSQELELAEKDPNYTNPYAKRASHQRGSSSVSETSPETKKKKKKTFKKGPHLSRQFGDL